MKTSCILYIITSLAFAMLKANAGYGTNSFFVTLGERQGGPDFEAIELAKTNVECQPADNDPGGHWGERIIGEQLSIRFKKDAFQTNEPVIATIIYRNAGTNDLIHGTPFGGDLDFRIVITDENGRQLPDSFVPGRTMGHGSQWHPGTQYKCQSNLTHRFGLSKPGTYSISVHRKLRIDNANGWADLASGIVTIKIIEPQK